jgi:hypothetical protein
MKNTTLIYSLMSQPSVLELMIPPHYQLGSTVVVRPSRFGVVLGSIPSLAILFSSYTQLEQGRSARDLSEFQQPGLQSKFIGPSTTSEMGEELWGSLPITHCAPNIHNVTISSHT